MKDLVPLEPQAAWQQRAGESNMHYAWFIQHAETLGERSELQTARRLGITVSVVRSVAKLNQWDLRIDEFDRARAEVTTHLATDENEALQMQYAVGIAMMRLGVQAVQLKNPALLKMDTIIKLMQQGSEMARRGAGVADLKIEKSVQQRIQSDFEDLLGE